MKKNFLTKIALSTMLVTSMISTVALASGDTCSFKFRGTGYGNLHCSWSSDQEDSGWAETSHPGVNGYSVTAYIESANYSGTLNGSDFDYGSTYCCTSTISHDTWRFNSTHGIASSANVYATVKEATCTDW